MYYEINVSHHGVHFFATHKRSLQDRDHAERVYMELVKAFPKEHGYKVTATYYEGHGRAVDLSKPA